MLINTNSYVETDYFEHLLEIYFCNNLFLKLYFEVLRCTLKELVNHQRAQGDKCVLFPSPPVFPVEYKWWNPEKGVHQEVVLDQPIEYFQWYGHTDFVRTADGQMHYEEKDAY